MALRLSSGLRNFLLEGGSLKHAFAGGKLELYTGTQPSSADDAVSGTLLCTYTAASGSHTAEVQATGSVALSGSSGSVDAIKVNSLDILPAAVDFDSDLSTTAAAVADAINNNPKNKLFVASASSGTITIKAKPGLGTLPNEWTVVSTVTTLTKTDTDMSGGVDSVNGLKFGDASSGQLVKDADQIWSGVAASTGTAGWFRLKGAIADAGSADASAVYHRLDGNVGTSGANLNLTSTSIASGATQTISTFSITQPAS